MTVVNPTPGPSTNVEDGAIRAKALEDQINHGVALVVLVLYGVKMLSAVPPSVAHLHTLQFVGGDEALPKLSPEGRPVNLVC